MPVLITAQNRSYEFYGFAQLDFESSNKSGSISSFNQKRLNLIGEYFLESNLRFLSDIEFEGGAVMDAEGNVQQGTIKVSRTWVEYTFAPELKLRAGKMLTPFGLYNLIHDASASYYSVDPPLLFTPIQIFTGITPQRLYGKYFVGIEALGTFDLNSSGAQLEYSFGIGNGRGADSSGKDVNQNKAIIGRLVFRPDWIWGLQFGTSFYTDRNHDGIGGIKNDRETTFGFDLEYDNDNLQIQAEILSADFTGVFGKGQTALVYYGQAAYTIWDVLTPFVNYTVVRPNTDDDESGFDRFNLGINWAVSMNLFLKTEFQFHTSEEEILTHEGFEVFKATAAVAF